MTKPSILIIEDDRNAGTALQTLLAREGAEVRLERDGDAGLKAALEGPFSLVISDIVMPKLDGMEVFRRLVKARPELPVIIMTAHGSIKMAVEAMREGAAIARDALDAARSLCDGAYVMAPLGKYNLSLAVLGHISMEEIQ